MAAFLVLSFAWAAPAHAADTCSAPTRLPALTVELDAAEGAFLALEEESLAAAAARAAAVLTCLGEPISPAAAARYHRLVGLRALAKRDTEAAARAFASARSIEPDYRFPADIVPTGHPIYEIYLRIPLSGQSGGVLVPAPRGALFFDGQLGRLRPDLRPVVLQFASASGIVTTTAYLTPADPLPEYPREVEPEADQPEERVVAATPLPMPPTRPSDGPRRGPNLALSLVAAGCGLAAAGVYAGATVTEQEYWDLETPTSELDNRRDVTNALVLTSGGLGILALGSGVGAVVAGRW